MARPRKTEGDRLVESIRKSIVANLRQESEDHILWSPDEEPRFDLIKETKDDLVALEAAWAEARDRGEFTVKGSRNQDVIHPLVAEIRAQRAALNVLLKSVKITPASATSGMSSSEKGRYAATARWSPEQARDMIQMRWGPGGTG